MVFDYATFVGTLSPGVCMSFRQAFFAGTTHGCFLRDFPGMRVSSAVAL